MEAGTTTSKTLAETANPHDWSFDLKMPLSDNYYLVDFCEEPFEAYMPRFDSEIEIANGTASEEDLDPVKQRTTTNRKTITKGAINLCNPNADYEPATAIRPEEPSEPEPDSEPRIDTTPMMELNDDKLVVRTRKTSSAIKATLKNDSISQVSIDKPEVAEVSFSKDTITVRAGKKKGEAVITVTSREGIVRSFSLKVQKGAVTTKEINGLPKKLTFEESGQTETYKVEAFPDRISTGEELKVKSSRKKVATASIDQATGIVTITAGKKGNARITVSAGKKKAVIKVGVKKP